MSGTDTGQAVAGRSLDPMFYPSSLALIGMSSKPDTFAGRLLTNLRAS